MHVGSVLKNVILILCHLIWFPSMKKMTSMIEDKRKGKAKRASTGQNSKRKAHATGEFNIAVKNGCHSTMHRLA